MDRTRFQLFVWQTDLKATLKTPVIKEYASEFDDTIQVR